MKHFPAIVVVSLLFALGCKKDAAPAPAEEATAEKPAETATADKAAELPPGHPPTTPDIPAPDDVAAPPADAAKTASGLASKVVQAGTGKAHPKAWDRVKVHYTGWTTDGKMFDSSAKRGQPAEFPLNRVIPGWTEGVQLMVVGEKRRLWIPGKLGYGEVKEGEERGALGPPKGTLVFDVELLEITEGVKPPDAPEDVAAVPGNAKKTKSGLASRVLKKGTGKAKPSAEDTVEVHYTGWTTDGKLFDSSVTRGQPARFSLNRVIPGWTEGVQLMVVGEKRRLWIPGKLAYGEKPKNQEPNRRGPPLGMLVFDVELLSIVGK